MESDDAESVKSESSDRYLPIGGEETCMWDSCRRLYKLCNGK